jgi:membrane protease YdiL (CAAX protease family)
VQLSKKDKSMKIKYKKVSKYLLLPLPFLIYLGLDIVLGVAFTLLYLQSYLNAYFLIGITHKGVLPDMDISTGILTDKMMGSLTELMILILPVLTGIYFFFWYRRLTRNEKDGVIRVRLFTLKNILLLLIAGCGLQLLTGGLLELILPYFKEIADEYNKLMEQITIGHPVLIFLSVVIIAPISEELTFRGVILKRALKVTPFISANIIQAILFGIAHLNIVQGIYAFGGGLAMGYVAYKFKTLKASILLHMFFNGLNFIIAVPSTHLYNILYIVIGALLTIVTLYSMRNVDKGVIASSQDISA